MLKANLDSAKVGYDVVIVGAGPAGCMVARHLSDKFNVLLVDSKQLPRDKPCGGMLVHEAKNFISKFLPDSSLFVEPKELDVKYHDFFDGSERLVKKSFLNVDRQKFDAWLFSILDDSNITVVDKTKLIDFTLTADGKFVVPLFESNGGVKPIVSRFLIGCDGAISTVREKCSFAHIPYYVAIQKTVNAKGIDCAHFIFDESISDFYSWLIPKNDTIVVGAALHPYKAREKFELFCDKVSKKFGIKIEGKITSAIILRPKNILDIHLGKGNVFLCGEAGGLISPTSGEGISFALESGKHCAEAINGEINALKSYKKACEPMISRIERKFLKKGEP